MFIMAKPKHEVAYNELLALLERHAGKVSAAELLAIAANAVGKIIAAQDRRTMTSEMAMTIVLRNLERGNAQAREAMAAGLANPL